MARGVEFFYHYFICPDARGIFWNWWLDEQASLMKKEGVRPKFYATLPKYWTSLNGIPIYRNGSNIDEITLEQKFIEYIELFYPNLELYGLRDTGEENLFEGYTLQALWDYSKLNPNKIVAYVHNKGVMSVSPHTYRWRQLLNRYFITEWRDRYIDLTSTNSDVVGMKDAKCDDTILSGNFFFATTNYIATLEEPYYPNNRYAYEKWILSGNPKVQICAETNRDHFIEY